MGCLLIGWLYAKCSYKERKTRVGNSLMIVGTAYTGDFITEGDKQKTRLLLRHRGSAHRQRCYSSKTLIDRG